MENIQKNTVKPSLDNSFSQGWNVMMKYFLILFLVVLVLGVVNAPLNIFTWKVNPSDFGDWQWRYYMPNINLLTLGIVSVFLGLFALAYTLLIVPVFRYGGKIMFVHAARDIRPDFNLLIQGFRQNYLSIVLANLLTGALIMLGIMALIIPGIIVGCRLAFVGYLVMDKKLDPILAVEESWRMTKGYGWTIFFMGIISFLIFIAGFCLFFVGIFPAIVWIKSSFARLYEAVLVEKQAINANGN